MTGRRLSVNVGEVVEAMTFQMDGAPVPYLDTETGEVAYARSEVDDFEPQAQHVAIPAATSHERYEVMALFAASETETEPDVAELMRVALDGKGGFRRFIDVIRRDPQLERRWRVCEDAADQRRAIAWLASIGIDPIDTSPVRAQSPATIEPPPPPVTLVDLLLLGAPGGRTERVGDLVRRVYVAEWAADAKRAFRKLARELAHVADVPWRTALIDGKTRFATGRFALHVVDATIELEVITTIETWRRFS